MDYLQWPWRILRHLLLYKLWYTKLTYITICQTRHHLLKSHHGNFWNEIPQGVVELTDYSHIALLLQWI